jgi:hypothetical protein
MSEVINLPLETQSGAGVSQNPQVGGGEGPAVEATRRDYYWSVTPKGPAPYNERGLASQLWGFNLDSDAIKPTLLYPPNNSFIPYNQTPMRFTWQPVAHAVEYVFTIYNRNADGSRGAILDSKSVLPSSQASGHHAFVELENEGVTEIAGYCWQVQAIGPENLPGPPSDLFCYGLDPERPILITPSEGANGMEYHPGSFAWHSGWAPGGLAISISEAGGGGAWIDVSGNSYSKELKPVLIIAGV